MHKIVLPALLFVSPSTALACDLDGLAGYGGMHRFNPFGGMREPPASAPARTASTTPQDQQPSEEKTRKSKASQAKPSRSSAPEEPRKWEVKGGSR